MNMTDREAAAVLRSLFLWATLSKGNGKSLLAVEIAEAIRSGAAAIERREPRPAIIKGRLFRRRYCPACHERVSKGGRFCRACGQAYRESWPSDYLRALHTTPQRGYGRTAGIVIIDEGVGRR